MVLLSTSCCKFALSIGGEKLNRVLHDSELRRPIGQKSIEFWLSVCVCVRVFLSVFECAIMCARVYVHMRACTGACTRVRAHACLYRRVHARVFI